MKWTGDRNAHINFEEKQKMDKIEELTSKNTDQTEGFKDRRPEWASHDYIYIVDTSAIKTSRPIQFKTEVNKSKLSNTFYVLLLMIFIYITKIQSGDLTIYSRKRLSRRRLAVIGNRLTWFLNFLLPLLKLQMIQHV